MKLNIKNIIYLTSRPHRISIYKSVDDGGYYWAINDFENNRLFNQRYDTEELAKYAVFDHLYPENSSWTDLPEDLVCSDGATNLKLRWGKS